MKPALAEVTLAACIYLTSLMVGAGLFASFSDLPRMMSNPPESFVTLQDQWGQRHVYFWITVHTCFSVALPLALWANWRVAGRRKLLTLVTVLYVAERVWSYSFFIPQMLSFYKVKLDGPVDVKLAARAIAWCRWNWLRVTIDAVHPVLLMAALILYPGTPTTVKVDVKRE